MPKGIWCNGITRHFDCLDPSPTLGIPVAEWRSLVISSGSYPEDRWFKSTFCYFLGFILVIYITISYQVRTFMSLPLLHSGKLVNSLAPFGS